jgi:hypothetical protein
MRKAKLNLVDLAGSEKWGTGEKDKDTKKELVKINSSLAALGNCISALANKSRKHIPYRDSPLTRLLQDSLGGGTRTIVIATVTPHPESQEESASTLQFANRATRVNAKITVNEVVNDAILLKRAQREISRLKEKLALAMTMDNQSSQVVAAAAPQQQQMVAVQGGRKGKSGKQGAHRNNHAGIDNCVRTRTPPPSSAKWLNTNSSPPVRRRRVRHASAAAPQELRQAEQQQQRAQPVHDAAGPEQAQRHRW